MEDDATLMRRCIELAQLAKQAGNTPVGSIVVLNGEIIGEGVEQLPAGFVLTGHAEVIACQNAAVHQGSLSLAGAILYSTAEPCFMCSYVIRQARIAGVCYGRNTPIIGGATSSHPILTDPGLCDWRPAVNVRGPLFDTIN